MEKKKGYYKRVNQLRSYASQPDITKTVQINYEQRVTEQDKKLLIPSTFSNDLYRYCKL